MLILLLILLLTLIARADAFGRGARRCWMSGRAASCTHTSSWTACRCDLLVVIRCHTDTTDESIQHRLASERRSRIPASGGRHVDADLCVSSARQVEKRFNPVFIQHCHASRTTPQPASCHPGPSTRSFANAGAAFHRTGGADGAGERPGPPAVGCELLPRSAGPSTASSHLHMPMSGRERRPAVGSGSGTRSQVASF